MLGWGVTIGAGLASYPLDTIRRRMMMTSGSAVHYKSMFDAGSQVRSVLQFGYWASLINLLLDHRQGGCQVTLQGCWC